MLYSLPVVCMMIGMSVRLCRGCVTVALRAGGGSTRSSHRRSRWRLRGAGAGGARSGH